jgi:hypothetical protein
LLKVALILPRQEAANRRLANAALRETALVRVPNPFLPGPVSDNFLAPYVWFDGISPRIPEPNIITNLSCRPSMPGDPNWAIPVNQVLARCSVGLTSSEWEQLWRPLYPTFCRLDDRFCTAGPYSDSERDEAGSVTKLFIFIWSCFLQFPHLLRYELESQFCITQLAVNCFRVEGEAFTQAMKDLQAIPDQFSAVNSPFHISPRCQGFAADLNLRNWKSFANHLVSMPWACPWALTGSTYQLSPPGPFPPIDSSHLQSSFRNQWLDMHSRVFMGDHLFRCMSQLSSMGTLQRPQAETWATTDQLDAQRRKLNGLNGEVDELRSKLGGMGPDINQVRDTIGGLEGEIDGLKKDVNRNYTSYKRFKDDSLRIREDIFAQLDTVGVPTGQLAQSQSSSGVTLDRTYSLLRDLSVWSAAEVTALKSSTSQLWFKIDEAERAMRNLESEVRRAPSSVGMAVHNVPFPL